MPSSHFTWFSSNLYHFLLMAACPFNRHLDEWSSTRSMKFYILQQWISLPLSLPLTHSLSGCDLATWLRCNPLPHDMSWAISVGCQATGPALDPHRRRRRAAWPRALQTSRSRLLTLTRSQQLHQTPHLPFTTLWWSAVTRNSMRSHPYTLTYTIDHRWGHASQRSQIHSLICCLSHTSLIALSLEPYPDGWPVTVNGCKCMQMNARFWY